MKKKIFVVIAFFCFLTSCEDDDFCDDPTTPKLIVGFYNKEDPTEKLQVPIYVWAENKDSIYSLELTDSILLPLNTTHKSTRYLLSTLRKVDTLDLTYTTSDVFISEGCGYIAHFNDFSGLLRNPDENSWIDRIEVNVTKIEDETETHIKVFH